MGFMTLALSSEFCWALWIDVSPLMSPIMRAGTLVPSHQHSVQLLLWTSSSRMEELHLSYRLGRVTSLTLQNASGVSSHGCVFRTGVVVVPWKASGLDLLVWLNQSQIAVSSAQWQGDSIRGRVTSCKCCLKRRESLGSASFITFGYSIYFYNSLGSKANTSQLMRSAVGFWTQALTAALCGPMNSPQWLLTSSLCNRKGPFQWFWRLNSLPRTVSQGAQMRQSVRIWRTVYLAIS